VWRSLSNRIIPKVESFLMKEKVDKHGSKNKSLRSSVVLALMKLYQKLPTSIFESKLPKLITCVCNALKNKDSNDRESASDTLSKMAVSLDMKYLPLILSELSISLSEGYKLHVRSATLHLILVSISKVDHQRTAESTEGIATLSLFDRCVPAMLDLIHQGKSVLSYYFTKAFPFFCLTLSAINVRHFRKGERNQGPSRT
jgi:U3 small nucleolar RNA-associated protein 20